MGNVVSLGDSNPLVFKRFNLALIVQEDRRLLSDCLKIDSSKLQESFPCSLKTAEHSIPSTSLSLFGLSHLLSELGSILLSQEVY